MADRIPCVIEACPLPPDDQAACHFPECGRPLRTRGLCHRHNMLYLAGEPLRPIRAKRPNGTRGVEPCEYGPCDRREFRGGYCEPHYLQRSRGQELRPIAARKPGGLPSACLRDADGNKRCWACGGWLPEEEFYRSSREADGLTGSCRSCYAQRARRSTCERYGLTEGEYDALLEQQGGVCAICRKPCERGCLSIDHDHRCCPGDRSCGKCVRGLLCRRCNQGLGNFHDDQAALLAAVAYLSAGSIAQ